MEPSWEARDVPVVLGAVVRYYTEHPQGQGVMLTCQQVADLTGLDPTDVYRALKRLEPTYVRLVEGLARTPSGCSIAGVTDAARRAVGQWPESLADGIIRGLLEAADREPDEAKRTKLRVAADALGGLGRDLLINAKFVDGGHALVRRRVQAALGHAGTDRNVDTRWTQMLAHSRT